MSSHEPCGIEVPVTGGLGRDHAGAHYDFSVWLTPEALQEARPVLNRHSLLMAKRERDRKFLNGA